MANNKKNSNLIVGLDIGTSKVVCIVGRFNSEASLLNLPTIQTTLDVPMSKPTIKLEFFLLFAIIQCNSIFVSHIYNTRILSILEQIM